MSLYHPRGRSRPTATLVLLISALVIVLAVAVLAAACGGGSSASTTATSAAAGGTQVSIKGFAFNPASVTVKAGESVTWTNQDGTTHTVTADNGGFDSGNVADGATFSFTFAKAGTYPYHCSIHSSMKGTVVVQ